MFLPETGVIHGRFQPFHLDHLTYVLEGKRRCKFLWIGITNPSPDLTTYDSVDPHRSLPAANPFTYWERLIMIRDALTDSGISYTEFNIVPLPINVPEDLKYYVPLNARFFVAGYDEWANKKVDILTSLGVEVDIMWIRSISDKKMSGTQIRQLMISDGDWENFLPLSVVKIIHTIGLKQVITRMKDPNVS